MSAPLKTALSSRLEMWKLLQNGSWFPSGICWSHIFPLYEHFLDGSLTQVTPSSPKLLLVVAKWILLQLTLEGWFEVGT
jgi:hypothetical protein